MTRSRAWLAALTVLLTLVPALLVPAPSGWAGPTLPTVPPWIYDASLDCMGGGAPPELVVYRSDRIILRTQSTEAEARNMVQTALGLVGSGAVVAGSERLTFPTPAIGGGITPVIAVSFVPPPGDPISVPRLARRLGTAPFLLRAAPDYFMAPSVTGTDDGPTMLWPDGPPSPADDFPPARAPDLDAGVDVAVFDIGLPDPTQSNQPSNVTRRTQADTEVLDVTAPFGVVDRPWAGHTVAIASTIATIAPGVSVQAIRITDPAGVPTDFSAAKRMATVLDEASRLGTWPDLMLAAFGTPACDTDPLVPGPQLTPIGMDTVTETIERHRQSVLIASAGNRASQRQFYPAAFHSVVSVGALDGTNDADGSPWTIPARTGPRANFSSYGGWVDIWTVGRDLITTHVKGYRFTEQGQYLTGYAEVSGTSYSAPVFAATVADQMVRSGQTATAAWQAVAASGVPCPALGGGQAVALASMSAAPTETPSAPAPPR